MTSVRLLLDCLTLARVALRPVGVGALLVGLGGAPGRAVVHIRAAVVGPTLHLWIYPFSIYLFYPSLIFYPWPYRRRAACTSWRPAPRCSLLRSWARPRPGSRPPPRATAASSLLRTPRTNPRHVTCHPFASWTVLLVFIIFAKWPCSRHWPAWDKCDNSQCLTGHQKQY